jgi:hypothetical protein
MPQHTVLVLMAGVAEALAAIHHAGIVHRDLKPSNVLLAADGPKVIDFGIARALEATSLTRTGMSVGSPQFISPDQLRGGVVTAAADMFALGGTACYAATGRAPFGEGDAASLLYRVMHDEPDLAGCPPALRPLITACLAKEPAGGPTPGQLIDACRTQAGPAVAFGDSWLPPAITADLAQHAPSAAPGPPTPPPGATAPPPAVPAQRPPGPAPAAGFAAATARDPGLAGPGAAGPTPARGVPGAPVPTRFAGAVTPPQFAPQPPPPSAYGQQWGGPPTQTPYRGQPQQPQSGQQWGPPPGGQPARPAAGWAGGPPAGPPYGQQVPAPGTVPVPPWQQGPQPPARSVWRRLWPVLTAAAVVVAGLVSYLVAASGPAGSPGPDRPSPTPASTLDSCVSGTWVGGPQVNPTVIGSTPVTLTSPHGLAYTFKPDGTGTVVASAADTFTGTYQGKPVTLETDGTQAFTWRSSKGELQFRTGKHTGSYTLRYSSGATIGTGAFSMTDTPSTYHCTGSTLQMTDVGDAGSEQLMRSGS